MAGLALESIKIEVLLNGKKALMGLKEFNKRIKGLNKPVKSVNNMFGKMFKLAGFAGFAKMAFDAQKLGRELGLISDKTGIAASKISKMQSAFSATGGNAKSLSRVITNITSGLARLSMGDASMASKLSAMGISAWDNGGNVKTSDVVLGDIAEWTKTQLDMGRSMQEVSQFLQDNFGIQQDLVNQLALGRSGFNQYQGQMAKTVGSLQDEEIDNLKSLNTSFSRLKETVVVLSDKIIAGVGPALEFFADLLQIGMKNLQDVFDYLVESFREIVGNGDEVAELFGFLKGVLTAFSLVLKGIVDVLKGFFQAIKMVGEWIGNFLAWVANKFGWLTGSTDDSSIDEKNRKNVEEYIKKNNLSTKEANELRLKFGMGKKESLFDELPSVPIYDEEGNLLDLSQIPLINEGGDNTNVEANVTNNFYGDVDKQQVADGVSNGIKVGIGATPAFNGGRIR
jgi:hypothetical protein